LDPLTVNTMAACPTGTVAGEMRSTVAEEEVDEGPPVVD
jgi:hypothetical protein